MHRPWVQIRIDLELADDNGSHGLQRRMYELACTAKLHICSTATEPQPIHLKLTVRSRTVVSTHPLS